MPYIEWRGRSCRVRWATGRVNPVNGKPLFDSKSSTDWTEEEAFNFGLDRESDIRNDRYVSHRDGSISMKEYCATWPDTLDVGHLRLKNIRSMLRNHIVPRWSDFSVCDIKPSQYRVWTKDLRNLPQIGDRYRREILTVFSMLMDDAVADGLRTASPIRHQPHRGKYEKKQREVKREMRIEAVDQLARNALTYWGPAGEAFIWTMAFTGMRPAEMFGLHRDYCHPYWPASDPDPDRRAASSERYGSSNNRPAIRVQYQRLWMDHKLQLVPPKYQSARTLAIPPFLADMLEKLLASHDSPWVFTSIKGGSLAGVNFSYQYWRRIADGIAGAVHLPEMPPVEDYQGKRLFLLRHGHKEWLDEIPGAFSRIAVENRMGHELAGVEGVYSNVTNSMELRIMNALQRRWERFTRQQKNPCDSHSSPIGEP